MARQPETHADRIAARTEVARSESDGFLRRRYHGQPRKGQPSPVSKDLFDAKIALRSLERVVENLEAASDQGRAQFDRDEAHRVALGQLRLVWRAIEKVCDRPHAELFRRRKGGL